MSQYEELFRYIDYFKNTDQQFSETIPEEEMDGKIIPGYEKYDVTFVNFTKAFYDSELVKGDYLDYVQEIENQQMSREELFRFIDSADFHTLEALLTYYVREERQQHGAMAEAAREGIFYRILKNLKKKS